ncbi:LysR family transcriptional regulator [Glacieibacterium frigidum]|uniref:LysR family transcriptional regulator n=1 Tax=Glacieibacterium frigidum TaxID=2593303 RepID=A0A552UER7_9SPHN|nr:LysR family transcriptional regulator [Glacieibacterium frigidum]TRW16717.1 LysR family transcriptional regulator [Glacieibacterium frigidum]
MDIQHLKSFLEIAKHRGFNRAAIHLNIAQSALSRQIKQLEHELGVELFERNGRGVQTTPAGERMLVHAELILKHIRQAREEIIAESDQPRGELNIGFPHSLEQAIGVPLLSEFIGRYRDVQITSFTGTSIELRERLLVGMIDLAVIGVLEPETILESHSFFRDPLYLVGPPGWAEGNDDPVAVADFADLPLLLTSRGNSLRILLENSAQRSNSRLNVALEVSSIPLTVALIQSGTGFAVLPYTCVRDMLQQRLLSARRLKNLSFNWVIVHSRERRLSAAGRQMVAMLQKFATLEPSDAHRFDPAL